MNDPCCHELLAVVPNDASVLYNLACVEARQDKKKESLATLAKAINEGWADADHLKVDDDLAALRDEPKFKELADKAHQNERTAYAKWYRAGKEIAGVKTVEDYPEDGFRYRCA